jgi:cytochrome c oxidase subunit I+III
MTALAALGWVAASAAIELASRRLRTGASGVFALLATAGVVLLVAACALMALAVSGIGVEPAQHAYGAMSHAFSGWQALHVAVVVLMGAFLLARYWRGLVDARRRATFDHMRILAHYTAAQGLLMLLAWQA